jgi:hypothetical protein
MRRVFARWILCSCVLGSLASSGCLAEVDDGDEDISTATQAFTASQCATATAVATFSVEYSWSSPANYGGACNAVDETNGGGSGLFLPYSSSVAPLSITTQAACQATTLRSVFYTRSGSTWVIAKDEPHQGIWTLGPFGHMECDGLSSSFPPPGGGIGVRVATTVRRPSGSSFITVPFATSFSRKPR